MTTSKALQDREDRGLRMAVAGVAALGMLFVGFFYVASGLVAPAWAIVALWIVWLALAWYGFRLARTGSYLVLGIPVLAGIIWFLVLTVSEQAPRLAGLVVRPLVRSRQLTQQLVDQGAPPAAGLHRANDLNAVNGNSAICALGIFAKQTVAFRGRRPLLASRAFSQTTEFWGSRPVS